MATLSPPNEEDDLQALLFLHLGGACVADIAHHIFGTPSAWTIHTCTTVPHIIPSPSFPTSNEIQCNIEISFKELLNGISVSEQKMLHTIAMFDELAVEKQPQWNDKSNKVLGFCYEHGRGMSQEPTEGSDWVLRRLGGHWLTQEKGGNDNGRAPYLRMLWWKGLDSNVKEVSSKALNSL